MGWNYLSIPKLQRCSEIRIGFYHFHARKCIWNYRLPTWRPFCPVRDEITRMFSDDQVLRNTWTSVLRQPCEVIYVFRNREAAKILTDFLFLLNLGFSSRHPLAAVCSISMRSNLGSILVLWIKQSYFNYGQLCCGRVHTGAWQQGGW